MSPPLPTPPQTVTVRSPRRLQDSMAKKRPPPQRSHSFNGKPATPLDQRRHIPRPRTQPDLLTVARGGNRTGGEQTGGRRVPSKVLVNVTVQRSLGPVQVMAGAEWTVAELITASVKIYVKEGRRPQLTKAEPASFSLHYSQFSLDCLDSKEKLVDLGSRNFFLCPRSISAPSTTMASGSCSEEVKGDATANSLFRFIVFLM